MSGIQTHLNHILRIGENELGPIASSLIHWAPNPTLSVALSESGNTDATSWAEGGHFFIGIRSWALPLISFWGVGRDLDLIGFYMRKYRNISADGITRR